MEKRIKCKQSPDWMTCTKQYSHLKNSLGHGVVRERRPEETLLSVHGCRQSLEGIKA